MLRFLIERYLKLADAVVFIRGYRCDNWNYVSDVMDRNACVHKSCWNGIHILDYLKCLYGHRYFIIWSIRSLIIRHSTVFMWKKILIFGTSSVCSDHDNGRALNLLQENTFFRWFDKFLTEMLTMWTQQIIIKWNVRTQIMLNCRHNGYYNIHFS